MAAKIAPPLQLNADGQPIQMTAPESDVYGRFDVSLSALLDQAYQRADQRYRNSAKLLAFGVAIALAVAGAYTIYGSQFPLWQSLIVGILATPLAPVAKDISSTIQAGAKVAQILKK